MCLVIKPVRRGRVTSHRESHITKRKDMQNLKKTVLFVLMAVFVASLAIVPAHAQGIAATVPFDFVVGKTTMKADSYRIETQGGFITLVDVQDGRASYALLSPGDDAANDNGQPYLVFTRYGTESFLSKVVFSADKTYNLPRSNREKEMIAHATSGEEVAVLIQPLR